MGEGLRMVHLRTVPDAWHAKVLAARLGAEGIVTELRGALSGLYPFGAVSVHVEEAQAELAADLLLADEVESAFTRPFSPLSGARRGPDDILPCGEPRRADDIQVVFGPGDDIDLRAFEPWSEDITPGPHHPISRKRRALAAFVGLMVAGAPVLAHFVGQ